jgi:hypothetical protein
VVNGVVGLDDPVAGAVAHGAITTAISDAFPAPSAAHLAITNDEAKLQIQGTIRASIAAGYYKSGLLSNVPLPADISAGGHLANYAQLKEGERPQADYLDWTNSLYRSGQLTKSGLIRRYFANVSPHAYVDADGGLKSYAQLGHAAQDDFVNLRVALEGSKEWGPRMHRAIASGEKIASRKCGR